MLFSWEGYAPGEKFADLIDRPVSYDVECMTEVAFLIHSVQFACTEQAVQQRSTFTSVVRAEVQPVFTTQTDHPQCIFSKFFINLDPLILHIVRQRWPLVLCIREPVASSEPKYSVFIFSYSQLSMDFTCCFVFRLHSASCCSAGIPRTSASMVYSIPDPPHRFFQRRQ